ncbi:MAG: SGNH/GDSL hydrolase family protein [Lentisphaerota bacterium]
MKTDEMRPAEAEFNGQKIHLLDIEQEPFKITGFGWNTKEHTFCRLPEHILSDSSVNEGARSLGWHTSGGMLRFKTNSPCLAIKAEHVCKTYGGNMSVSGTSGFDIYLGRGACKKYHSTAIPLLNFKKVNYGQTFGFDAPVSEVDYNFESFLFSGKPFTDTVEVTINLPLFDGVKNIQIGVAPGSEILPASPFKYSKPIAFYGSSITQGGCASRPGNAYTNILGRRLDVPVLNFGFSGCGKGEPAMARAIAELEMSAFVLDYDHNAPSIEHLEKTHEQFMLIIRDKQPNLPILIMTRCDYDSNPENADARAAIIKKTYDNAVSACDKNVYFIHGKTLFGKKNRDACTVDGCHPNDLGFVRMADKIYTVLKEMLEKI